jgi:CDGSH-type Zn-finger protein/truncated hemoglobin YjbI
MTDETTFGPDALNASGIARAMAALAVDGGRARWPPIVVALLSVSAGAITGDVDDDPATVVAEAAVTDAPAALLRLWELAERATELWLIAPTDAALALVAAMLQSACRLVDGEGDAEASMHQRWSIMSERVADIAPFLIAVRGGPLVLTGDAVVTDHLGCVVAVTPVAALCRCGLSGIKPGCDSSCFVSGFDDAKDPNRVVDRKDSYEGQQVTVFDNRGICQHSGFCTDRLAGVFHQGSEPFVTPSGGRMDEIIRAVRDCPSGALSYGFDDIEARDQVDWGDRRPSQVQVSKDGPYRVIGSVRLVGAGGTELGWAEGASREHFALCRCGHSQNKPFCSGMHWYVGFQDPQLAPTSTPSIFEWAGGLPALTRMTRLFYERYVPADDLLAPLFATMSADHPQRVAQWLSEVFGGPSFYSTEHGGYAHMLAEHRGRELSEAQRGRWVELLMRSAVDAGLPNDAEFRAAFGSYIEWGSRLAFENSQSEARPPEQMPMPRWDWTTAAGPPGSRISALHPIHEGGADGSPTLPGPEEAVRFTEHVKSMFREQDRKSMLFAFDLWSYDDVCAHATDILSRVRAGSMPCDGAWPSDRVAAFARWIDDGTPA